MNTTEDDNRSEGDQACTLSAADFKDLLDQARAGSHDAQNQLIERFRPYLLLLANTGIDPKVRAKVAASDVVQETMVAALNDLENFRGESIDAWMAWLKQILTNDLRQTRRRFRGTSKRQIDREVNLHGDSVAAKPPIDVPADQLTPGADAVAREESIALEAAMKRLKPDHQEVIRLKMWQDLSFVEIGRRMGRSSDAVRKLWYRAFVLLQAEVESDERESDS